MRFVAVKEDYSGHGMEVKAGESYIVEDPTLAHFLNLGIAGDVCEWLGYCGIPTDPSKVLLTRGGGFGDLLFLTPLIRSLIKTGVSVHVCCLKQYRDALSGVDVTWHQYPMSTYDPCVHEMRNIALEGVVEFTKTPEVYMSDLFAEAAGVELTDGRHLSFAITEEGREWAAEHYPRREAYPFRVGIQPRASVPTRSYPHYLMVRAIQLLIQRGAEIAIFGNPKSITRQPNSHPAMLYVSEKAETFMQSAAVLAECDAFLGPDSALVHVAGALGKPTVALYGPFPWQARTKYAPSIKALSGALPCAPCYWHGRRSTFPLGKPCHKSGKCEALAQIDPERIVREILKHRKDAKSHALV